MQDCEASDGVATTNMTSIDTAITAIGMGHSVLFTVLTRLCGGIACGNVQKLTV
jgi:hypothetical protein